MNPPSEAGTVGAPWPLPAAEKPPRRSAWRRAVTVGATGALVLATLVVSVLVDGLPGLELGSRRREPTPEEMRDALLAGEPVRAPAAAFGHAPWCPRYHELGWLTMTPGKLAYEQGLSRDVDVAGYRPTGVHRGGVPVPLSLPAGWWVLEITGSDGTVGHLAAAPDVLAVVGAATSWPAPPGWDAVASLRLFDRTSGARRSTTRKASA